MTIQDNVYKKGELIKKLDHNQKEKIKNIIKISAIVGFAILFFVFSILFFKNTEIGKRFAKDVKSNLDGGIERVVKVYDINGDLIEEYSGKFELIQIKTVTFCLMMKMETGTLFTIQPER